MSNTLKQEIESFRQGITESKMSKLSIDGSVYAIKDPAVEKLAEEVETRLSAVESKNVRSTALTKANDAGAFATKVEQAVDGQITVEYSNFTANNDSAVTNQFVTSVSQATDGQITVSRSTIDGTQIGLSTPVLTYTNVDAALRGLVDADAELLGNSGDLSTYNTIYGAKAYAKNLVDQILGEDSASSQLETLKAVIAELKDASASGGIAGTVLDTISVTLAGMEYTDNGQTVTATSVADYVTHKIAEVNAANSEGIADLDATVGSTTVAQDKHVAVQVVETDGKLTGLTVTESDIASATALQTLDGAAVKTVNTLQPTSGAITLTGENIDFSSTDTTKLNTYLNNLVTTKANKNAIQALNINNWSSYYTSATETVCFANTVQAAYCPVPGQPL